MYTTFINAADLFALIQQEKVVIFDCRFELSDTDAGRRAYKNGHIKGAIYAHLDDDLSGEIIAAKTGRHPLPIYSDFVNRIEAWGIKNEQQIVVYDDKGGAIAARLWWMMQVWMGHKKVAVLNGGLQAWTESGFELRTTTPTLRPSSYTPQPKSRGILNASEVLTILEDDDYKLIDSRDAKRYSGEHEPIDPIAGHIPSAISAPFMKNWTDKKYIKAKSELKTHFETLLGNTPSEKSVFYCGSGVTACYNLLALKHAGLGEGLLYPGSWSDWITDTGRPLIKKH